MDSLEPVYLAELRNNRLLKVLEVIVCPLGYRKPSPHPSNHIRKPPLKIGRRIFKIDDLQLTQYFVKNSPIPLKVNSEARPQTTSFP
jgi:hypothetical protein